MNQFLKLNDMVLIKDNELLPRNQWRKGVVHELVVGSDNQVRGHDTNNQIKLFNRSKKRHPRQHYRYLLKDFPWHRPEQISISKKKIYI